MSKFIKLGESLAQVVGELQFAQPTIVQHEGRTYYSLAQVGEVHGLDTLIAYDEHNEEYRLWDGGSPYLDWCSTAVEEAEHHEGIGFETVEELIERMRNPVD